MITVNLQDGRVAQWHEKSHAIVIVEVASDGVLDVIVFEGDGHMTDATELQMMEALERWLSRAKCSICRELLEAGEPGRCFACRKREIKRLRTRRVESLSQAEPATIKS